MWIRILIDDIKKTTCKNMSGFLVPQKKFNSRNAQNKTNKNKKDPKATFVVFAIYSRIFSVGPKNNYGKNNHKKNSEN